MEGRLNEAYGIDDKHKQDQNTRDSGLDDVCPVAVHVIQWFGMSQGIHDTPHHRRRRRPHAA